jgi:hypothetical protein
LEEKKKCLRGADGSLPGPSNRSPVFSQNISQIEPFSTETTKNIQPSLLISTSRLETIKEQPPTIFLTTPHIVLLRETSNSN